MSHHPSQNLIATPEGTGYLFRHNRDGVGYAGSLQPTGDKSSPLDQLLTKPYVIEQAVASKGYTLSYAEDGEAVLLGIYVDDHTTMYTSLKRVQICNDAEVSRLTARLEKLEATMLTQMALMDERITALKAEMYEREDYALLEK